MRSSANAVLGPPPALAEYAARPGAPGRLTGGARARGGARPAPLISVITVVRNAAATLPRTVESVLAAAGNVEYVVVDGGSTDGTLDLLRGYGGAIDFWLSESDSGIYDAMNKGIALTRGAWIGLLNADDWYLPGALEAVADAARAHAAAGVLYGGILHRHPGHPDATFVPPARLRPAHFHFMPVPHAASLVRRTVYERLGLYRTDLRLAGDYEIMLRCYAAGVRFAYVPRALAGVQGGGLSDTQTERYWAETRRVFDAYDLGVATHLRHEAHVIKARLLRRLRSTGLGYRGLRFYRALRGRARAAVGRQDPL